MLNGTLFNGSSSNGASSCPVQGSQGCNQCGEKRSVLPYVFPTQSGKKEFCSEPCLSGYRNAQKGIHTLSIQVRVTTCFEKRSLYSNNAQRSEPANTKRMKFQIRYWVNFELMVCT